MNERPLEAGMEADAIRIDQLERERDEARADRDRYRAQRDGARRENNRIQEANRARVVLADRGRELAERERDEARGVARKYETLWREAERAGAEADRELAQVRAQRDALEKALEKIRDDRFKASKSDAPDWEDTSFWMADEAIEALAFGQEEIIELGPEDSQRVAESLKNPSPPNDALQKLMDERLKDDRGSVLFRRAAFRNMPPVPRFRDKESVRKFVEETRAMMSPSLLDMAGFPRVEDLDDNDG